MPNRTTPADPVGPIADPEALEGKIARQMDICGMVQGVGFRPFIYRAACRFKLSGHVANIESGVRLHVEGRPAAITDFIAFIRQQHPPLARITAINLSAALLASHSGFRILKSRVQGRRTILIPPDTCICRDCLEEMLNPHDRRHGYAFINCTNCGPRYTIIRDLPYDRGDTTMEHFSMCATCRMEYEDPGSRRFHAQPNACPACGPQVRLVDIGLTPVTDAEPVKAAAALLQQGKILAIKGLGGFHLAVDAQNPEAVACLRQRKNRPDKPLALMAPDLETVRTFARITRLEQSLLDSPQAPIVLLRKRRPHAIAPNVAPDNDYFGVMLPYTPLHHLLLRCGFTALVMTSGNLSGEPLAKDNTEALDQLGKVADYFLFHDRDIHTRADDSIVRVIAGRTTILRRSRGYAPAPIDMRQPAPPILAVGADLKNTICLTNGHQAFLSQHIGDLDQARTHDCFAATITHLQNLLDIHPTLIAHDLHPGYRSVAHALGSGDAQKLAVQHHHAHIVSCMVENQLDGPVIGLAFDGTGYGIDGNLWGGEILIADEREFRRRAHLAYVPMPGGQAAIKAPWRMALSYLFDAFGPELDGLNLPLLRDLPRRQVEMLLAIVSRKINAPLTSSLGRLFDGVAGILGLRYQASFEGQAAMALETIARGGGDQGYAYEWRQGDIYEISVRSLIRGMVADVVANRPPALISMKFHHTLIRLFTELCTEISSREGIRRVVLSGGVFQNQILLRGLMHGLSRSGMDVFVHHLVPTNDGGISLGQAGVAAARARG